MVLVLAGCASGSAPGWTFGPAVSPLEAPSSPTEAPVPSGTASGTPLPAAPTALAPTASPTASSAAPPAAALDPRRDGLEVGFGEWAVVPEAAVIRPGKVTFIVRNGGTLTHGFELEREDGDGDDEFEVEGPEFDGGDTVEITATLRPGTYELYCYIGDHEDRGMTTQLVVREDAPLQTPSPTSQPGDQVEISGFAFAPPDLRVETGTEVTWQNQDPAEHTVTAEGGAFGSDPMAQGQQFSTRFEAPGTYAYFCAIHPSMRGTVEVT